MGHLLWKVPSHKIHVAFPKGNRRQESHGTLVSFYLLELGLLLWRKRHGNLCWHLDTLPKLYHHFVSWSGCGKAGITVTVVLSINLYCLTWTRSIKDWGSTSCTNTDRGIWCITTWNHVTEQCLSSQQKDVNRYWIKVKGYEHIMMNIKELQQRVSWTKTFQSKGRERKKP